MTHLHGYIQSLKIRLQVDYGVPSPARLRSLIRGLTSLRSLIVQQSPRVARELLAPPSATTLPNLTHLSLDQCFESRTDFPHPFNPQLYASIGTYGKLCRLSVTVHDATTSRQLPSASPKYKGKPIPSLGRSRSWAITLHGPLAESPAALDLVSSFKVIDTLDLYSTARSDSIGFDSFVDSFQSPQQVQHLRLACNLAARDSDAQDLIAHLPRLKSITFDGSAFQASLLSTLASLTDLREVVFSAGAVGMTDAALSAMVNGPHRFSRIRLLRVDVRYQTAQPFWPRMVPTLTVDGTIANVKRAEKHGIRLEGSTIDVARKYMRMRGNL